MCDPVTAIAGAGAVTNVIGTYQQIESNNLAAEMNANLLEQNAALAEQKAQLTQKQGEKEELRHRRRVSKVKGAQRSGFASSGVVVDTGSALDTLIDTVKTEELDAAQIRENTAIAVWSQKSQAQDFRNQAILSRSKKQSKTLALLGAGLSGGETLLGTPGGKKFLTPGATSIGRV